MNEPQTSDAYEQQKIRLANGLWVVRSDWLAWRERIEDGLWLELYEWHEAKSDRDETGR